MDEIFAGIHVVLEQAIRLLQVLGLPIFSVMVIVGLLLLLTAGKNPRRKKLGYVFVIVFGISALLVAYAPLIALSVSEADVSSTGNESIEEMVDGSRTIGSSLFKGVWYLSIPVVFTMFYFGLLVRLSAAKNPMKKRLGLGMMLFSPVVLLITYVLPHLTKML